MASYLTTKDFKMPTTKKGEQDKRFKTAQFCKDNGTRDMRTKLTSDRKNVNNSKSSNTSRKTVNLVIPTKNNGTKDERYTKPQFCNSSGKKDKRTTATRKK